MEKEKWCREASGCKLSENLNKHSPWIASVERSACLWEPSSFIPYPLPLIFPTSVKIAFIFYCLRAQMPDLRMLRWVSLIKTMGYIVKIAFALYRNEILLKNKWKHLSGTKVHYFHFYKTLYILSTFPLYIHIYISF